MRPQLRLKKCSNSIRHAIRFSAIFSGATVGTKEATALIQVALRVKRRGWQPLYVPLASKNPGREGWQRERLTENQIPGIFSQGGNLSIITGDPSGGLTDIDLDVPETLACADDYLPPTGMIHGRPSKPNSHWWYVASPSPRLVQWQDIDGTMLVELRGTGGHTLIPPSVHPEGEALVWTRQDEPQQVELAALQASCQRIAATALLARHWPARGSRHLAALAVGGFLLRSGLDADLAASLVETAARVAGDEEWLERRGDVLDTARNLSSGKPVTGIPTMASLFAHGEKIIAKLCQWLSLKTPTDTSPDWSPPLPFLEITGPPFPLGVFPQPIQEFVAAQAIALQTPLDLIGGLVLGTSAAAVAGRCVMRLNQEWAEPLNIFIVIVLPSGERKSPGFRAVTAPLEERERELAMNAQPEIALLETEADILTRRLQEAKSQAAKAKKAEERERLAGEAAELAQQLVSLCVPVSPRLIADDATSEAIASLLAEQGGRIAVMSTEGGLFETLAGRYTQGMLSIDVYLKGYSGDPLRIDRKSRPPEYVPSPTLTLCLTVQPDVIRELVAKPGFRGRGLLARILYSLPRSLVGYRSSTASPVPDAVRQRYHRRVKDLLKLPDPPEGKDHSISLSPEAHQLFQDYRGRVERQLRPGAELHDIQDWGNKLSGSVARLAGILHLLEHSGEGRPWEIPLDKTTMEGAIKLGDYFAAHANVAFSMMGADPRMEKARRLWSSIEHLRVERFSQRDLWQHIRRSFAPHEVGETLQLLVEMGYLRLVPAQDSTGPGRPRSPVFEVNPLAGTQNPQNPQNPDAEGNFEDFVDFVYASPANDDGPDDDVGGGIGMNPQRIVEQARVLGITLWVMDNRIFYAPKSQAPAELVKILRQHKQELLAHLSPQPDVSPQCCTQNPQNPQKPDAETSPVGPVAPDMEHLLAWAAELAEQELVLPRPVSYVEAPLRTISTQRVSYYAALYLREISYARLQQRAGGWGSFTLGWFKEQERGAIEALAALREAMQTQVDQEANS
jgi:replicative DNA helicase